jgi:class 3 adenylate cyclase
VQGLDRRQRAALTELTEALRNGIELEPAARRLRDAGFSGEEIALLRRAAEELSRVDGLLHRYLGPRLAEQLHREPAFGDLGGREREITALFADLAGFTSFSEDRSAAEVVSMLNAYWGAVVPAIVDGEGGVIERFAGDGLLAVFNALGDQPDHGLRAARAAVEIQARAETLRRRQDDWPRFRVGLSSGPAVIGSVGTEEQRSFSAIGDTTNVAARLQTIAAPGEIVLSAATLDQLAGRVAVDAIGPVELKGKSQPVDAYRLVAVRE